MDKVGYLLLLAVPIAATYWFRAKGTAPRFFLMLTAYLFVGIFLVLRDRITEVTVGSLGTIKAAEQQAVADAGAIAEIRKRIEGQSAVVDLVAGKATEAENKATQAQELIAAVSKDVAYLEGAAQLDMLQMQAIASDNSQEAFDRVLSFATVDQRLSDKADMVLNQIYEYYRTNPATGDGLPILTRAVGQPGILQGGIAEGPRSVAELVVYLHGETPLAKPADVDNPGGGPFRQGDPDNQVDGIKWAAGIRARAAYDLRFFKCREVPPELIEQIRNDKNLEVKKAASESLAILTNLAFRPQTIFPFSQALDWWNEHGAAFAASLPPCDMEAKKTVPRPR